MADGIKLVCWIHGDTLKHVFGVTIKLSETVGDLKKAIRTKKPSFQGIDAASLGLWKFHLPLRTINDDSVQLIQLEDDQELISWEKISTFWGNEPSYDILSVIIRCPVSSTTFTHSPSNRISPPDWLLELHGKLWGKRHLFDQIFRSVHLTKPDFIELQNRLQNLNPSRCSRSYVAEDVLGIKSDFLRSRSFTDIKCYPSSENHLVPRIVVNKTADLNPSIDDDVIDDDDMGIPMDIAANPEPSSLSYITADADFLSEGSDAVFPCTVRFLDLTFLKLKHLIRIPHLMCIRDEWMTVVDIVNKRRGGIRGSAVFTGEQGIGKTCLLYQILILCFLYEQTVVFQDHGGRVFVIDDKVQRANGNVVVPGDDVLTLVDADGDCCVPNQYLLDAINLRILLVSSLRSRRDWSWLEQSAKAGRAVYVMEPWTRGELLVVSLFLESTDITLARFEEATRICGHIPRTCFAAAQSPDALSEAEYAIVTAIKVTENLAAAIIQTHGSQPIPHPMFELYPAPHSRSWSTCRARLVSEWASFQIVVELDRRGADAAYNFYQLVQGSPDGAAIGRRIFENKVHRFFSSTTKPRSFRAYSLDDRSVSFDIVFSSDLLRKSFGLVQDFTNYLSSSINDQQSCYLTPLSPSFAGFDSFLHQHGTTQLGYQPLIGFQISSAREHPISPKGLAVVQMSLNRCVPVIRPAKIAKLIILFVVPESMAASFVKQPFKDSSQSAHWDLTTAQFVLGLPEGEVLRTRISLLI